MAKLAVPGWLRAPRVPPGGQMGLADHLRELRYRFVVSLIAVVVAMLVCSFYEKVLERLLTLPFNAGVKMLRAVNPNIHAEAINAGFIAPFMLWMKLVGIGGLLLACPVWIYQLWAFVMPGLLAREKKWALRFVLSAVPLFLLGCLVGYWVIPQGISAMLLFTPDSIPVTNLIDLNSFLDLMIKMVLVFGLAFLLPVVLVALNLVGVISGAQLAKARPYGIFASFVIGAIATPGTDPFSMLALAIPLSLLYEISEVIARLNDKRKGRAAREAA